MIVTGGENVFPGEVEDVLRRHPKVADVVIYGMPDDRWGERVEAGVVPALDVTVELEELRAHARPVLASYKLPKTMRLLDEIPLTSVQKADRRAAREDAIRELRIAAEGVI
jgi:acyl-CoA synthetase (AMP-forming)/AMP-acid ligase II